MRGAVEVLDLRVGAEPARDQIHTLELLAEESGRGHQSAGFGDDEIHSGRPDPGAVDRELTRPSRRFGESTHVEPLTTGAEPDETEGALDGGATPEEPEDWPPLDWVAPDEDAPDEELVD